MERKTQKVLGYDVDNITFDNAVEKVMQRIQSYDGMQIVTLNPEIIEIADKNKEYADIIQRADMVLPDSSGIKFALKLKGTEQEQIPGIDFSKALIKKCVENNYPVALIGAHENVVVKVVAKLREEFPTINICYFRSGYYMFEEEEKIIEDLKQTKPKLVLLALGAPKQEQFMSKCRGQIGDAVFIGVGGTFDVWAGDVKRAPEFMRKIGCEWLYRTINEPKRIKRIYKTLPSFLIKAIKDAKN